MFTTDTRKAHCPVRIVYSEHRVGPIDSLSLARRLCLPRDIPLAIIKDTEHSDYSGDSVEASNYVRLQELSVEEPALWPLVEIYGSHGYQALAYDATLGPVPPTSELCDALDGFENGAHIFDEHHHIVLESELEEEAWADYGRSDFRRRLENVLDTIDAGHEHILPEDDDACPVHLSELLADTCFKLGTPARTWTDLIDRLWYRGCDILGGSGHAIETGCTVHFYIAEWFTKLGRETDRPALHPIVQAIGEACRVDK